MHSRSTCSVPNDQCFLFLEFFCLSLVACMIIEFAMNQKHLCDCDLVFTIDTPASGSVTTSSACLNCPVDIFGRKFGMDLVCLPLEGLDVILEMNWLQFNRVHINCFTKTVIFPEEVSVEDLTIQSNR